MRSGPLSRAAWLAIGGLFVVFLLSPLLLVIFFAFTSRGIANFPIEGLSLRWWGEMAGYRTFEESMENSLIIAVVVGIVSAVVGTMAAIGFSRLPPKRAGVAITVLCLPLMLPPLVLAVALLSLYVSVGMRLGIWTVAASHLLFTLPFVIIVVYARMTTFDYRLVESARDLGASPFRAFRTVTLPIIQPVVIGAALIAVALSLDDFVITFYTIGSGNTLPTMIWGMMRTSLTPAVNAVGTLLIALSIGSTLVALRLTRYRG